MFIEDTLKDSNEISSNVMEMTLEMILTELSMCAASVCFEHCEWSVKKCDLRKGWLRVVLLLLNRCMYI